MKNIVNHNKITPEWKIYISENYYNYDNNPRKNKILIAKIAFLKATVTTSITIEFLN